MQHFNAHRPHRSLDQPACGHPARFSGGSKLARRAVGVGEWAGMEPGDGAHRGGVGEGLGRAGGFGDPRVVQDVSAAAVEHLQADWLDRLLAHDNVVVATIRAKELTTLSTDEPGNAAQRAASRWPSAGLVNADPQAYAGAYAALRRVHRQRRPSFPTRCEVHPGAGLPFTGG